MAGVTLASPSVKLNSNHMYTSFAFHRSLDDPAAESFAAHLNLMRKSFLPELGDSEPNHTSIRINLGRKRIDNGELDIFDAKKYFSGVMDPADETASEKSARFSHKKEGEGSVMSKSKSKSGSGSTWSVTTSANSQSILLRNRRKCSPPVERRQASGKRFLGVFRCSCSGKDGIDVEKHAGEETGLSNGQKISYVDEIDGRNPMEYWREGRTVWHRREAVALPVSNLAGEKVAVGREADEKETVDTPVGVFGPLAMGKHETNSSFRRSLTLLSSTPAPAAAAAGGGNGDGDDIASEASSDLFEIESLSINGHPLFQPEVAYEPSEASIEWSVVTASAANFSVASDNIDDIAAVRDIHDAKKLSSKQRRPSLLMGCVSQNAVNVNKPERRQEIPTATPARCYTDVSYKMDFEPVRSQRALAVSHARSMR